MLADGHIVVRGQVLAAKRSAPAGVGVAVAELNGRFRGLCDPETRPGAAQQREPSDASDPRKECGGQDPPQTASLQGS